MDVLDDYVGKIESDVAVQTTVDPAIQAVAERALVDELNQKGGRYNVGQGAVVTMRPDGRSARSSAGATTPRASSTAPPPPSASPARPSSPSSTSRRSIGA